VETVFNVTLLKRFIGLYMVLKNMYHPFAGAGDFTACVISVQTVKATIQLKNSLTQSADNGILSVFMHFRVFFDCCACFGLDRGPAPPP